MEPAEISLSIPEAEELSKLLTLLLKISENVPLFYFLAIVTIAMLAYLFMKAIMEFISSRQTTTQIAENNRLLGRVETKLDILFNK